MKHMDKYTFFMLFKRRIREGEEEEVGEKVQGGQ
jgi:hypothetical protein